MISKVNPWFHASTPYWNSPFLYKFEWYWGTLKTKSWSKLVKVSRTWSPGQMSQSAMSKWPTANMFRPFLLSHSKSSDRWTLVMWVSATKVGDPVWPNLNTLKTNQNDNLWQIFNTALTNCDQLRPTFCLECIWQCATNGYLVATHGVPTNSLSKYLNTCPLRSGVSGLGELIGFKLEMDMSK